MVDSWLDRLGRAVGDYASTSYEGLSRGAKAVREATDPFQYAGQATQAATSMLPGAGLVEGQQDFARMGQALKEGRYRDAAIDAGYGLVNAGTEFIPAMAAMPAIRRPGANIAERAQPRPGETIAYVDPSAVDEAWRADPGFYIPPGAGTGKYEGAVEYLQGAGPVEAPSLGVMPDSLGFADGRHRFAAMRDMGLDRIPVSMDPASLENARARGLIDDMEGEQRMASGGAAQPEDFAEMERSGYHHAGVFPSSVPGRTDKLPVTVAAGSYIVPADVVSALGEGNTLAGTEAIERQFGSHKPRFATGGGVKIIAAGGEYAIPPEVVKKVGGGDMDKGHDILDRFVVNIRKKNIKTLKSLPGPAK